MLLKRKLEKYLKEYLEPKKDYSFTLFDREESSYEREEMIDRNALFKSRSINEYIETNIEEDTFQTKLFHYIDSKNLKDSDVYNKVNIDRRLFSKIRNDNYHPSKDTIILLGLSLELDENQIEKLLDSASYSLPKNNNRDLIIRFCFIEHIYNPIQVNEFLDSYNCSLLN